MSKPIKIKINVTKIQKEHLYRAKSGAIYLNCAVFPNQDGRGDYGDTHFIVQEMPREAREAGTARPIIGNMSVPEDEAAPPSRGNQAQPQTPPPSAKDMSDEDIPF